VSRALSAFCKTICVIGYSRTRDNTDNVTDLEKRASFDRLERATWDVCFLVSIFQVREEFVSFFVSFLTSARNASIAFIVSIPHHASMDG